ncbi:MAG: hypothetical protein ABIG69_08050 [Bacteroidota bacterium]|nr:hypothetical protein [Bacteroidota bacterium]
MKKHFVIFTFIIIPLLSYITAQVPNEITYQGILKDADGTLLTDEYNLLFRIYTVDIGGTEIWNENHVGVHVEGGVFNIILGNLESLSFEEQYWLGITVNGGTELQPRSKLTAVPYSLTAKSVPEQSITLDKINTSGASNGQTLIFNGTALDWQTPSSSGLTLPYTGTYSGGGHIMLLENLLGSSTVRMVDFENYGPGEVLYLYNSKNSNSAVLSAYNDGNGKVAKFKSSSSSADNAVEINSWSNQKAALYVNNSGSANSALFDGDVEISGSLSKSSGSFKIDHPLDPENKYLYHSFAESPDMMNIYNGNIILNSNGEGLVLMPEWFSKLNKEFRYQLTCIGGYSPIFISEEISENKFKISGGKPGLKISWQVTGIRQDPYANANRISVEVDKPSEERGYYLHYKEYDQPMEKSVEAARKEN